MSLDRAHLECVGRQRRLLNLYDPNFFNYKPELLSAEEYAEVVLDFTRCDEFRLPPQLYFKRLTEIGIEKISIEKIELDIDPKGHSN